MASTELGYRYGNRPIEKIVAFGLSMAAVLCLAWKNQSLSVGAGTGLLLGVLATFIINMLGVSAMSEGTLVMLAVVVIGLKFGAAAFGMSILGWLMFSVVYVVVVSLTNRMLDGH
jgi:hypothetical protein